MTIHSNWLQRKENNACIDVAWGLYWGRSRSTKPCVLPCKVAAACNEIPRVCCGCGWGRSGRKFGSSPVFCNGWFVWLQILVKWLHDCHVLSPCVYRESGEPSDAAKRIVMAAWMLHGACIGDEAGARNLVFFCVKWLRHAAALDERYLVRAGCAAALVLDANWFLLRVIFHARVSLCAF